MSEQTALRRRNQLKRHYTITSNVLIFGYHHLDDSAKLTYQAIDSFDWPDERGERKGYAYPSVPTLARMRGISERTIQRHIDALQRAGLLTREVRPGQPSLLWLEEPASNECTRYLSTLRQASDTDVTTDGDTDVTPYKKEESETDKTVNGSEFWKQNRNPTPDERAKRDWLADKMLEILGDDHSIRFYHKVARDVPEHRIFEALSEVKIAAREGRIRASKGRMFVGLVSRAFANGS